MNSKLRKVLVGVTAAAVLAGSALTATSASAKPWQDGNSGQWQQHSSQWQQRSNYSRHHHYGNDGYYGGYGYNDGVGVGILGFIAGAVVGNALSHSYDDNSCYRFKTYNPHTGMYMSYHGPRHCP